MTYGGPLPGFVVKSRVTSESAAVAVNQQTHTHTMSLSKLKMVEVNQQFEDDSHGSGGSTSSIDEVARVDASKEAETERMICIYKEVIRPMLRADINAEQQKFLSLVKEKFGLDLLTSMTWNFDYPGSTSGSQALQLQFLNGISTPVSTGMDIEGEDHKPFTVALVDRISGEIVSTGDGAAAKVEIVALEGDCNDDEAENWSSQEFNNKIIRDWNGKKVLQGNTFLNLKEGIGYVDKISFTHNSTWKKKRNCRLGARSVNAAFATSVKEAKTESFLVKDKRKSLYNKHPTPSLSDELWRLYQISRRGACFIRLSKANIKTVMDFRTLLAINPKRLKDILDVHANKWKIITDHAQMCKDDKGIYLYHHPRDGHKSNGVVFNISGQLVGLVAKSQFIPRDKLPNDKKAAAQELVVSSSEHWKEVVSFNDEASLINHLQSDTTLNSLRVGLNVVIPQTIDTHDHTCLTSPQVITPMLIGCTNNQNEWGYDNVGVAGQSQSPKRSASEHAVSSSPKKQRDDHPQMSPSTPDLGTRRMTCMKITGTFNEGQEPNNLEHSDLLAPEVMEDDGDEYLKYLNFPDGWKTLSYMVGWISLFSKVRKRRTTFCHQLLQTSDDEKAFVIAASIEQAQT